MSRISEALKHVPWDEVQATIDALVEAGWKKDAALDMVARMLDQALPLDVLVPGPAGAALEAIDGPVLRAALGLVWNLATNKKGREARKVARAKAASTQALA